MNYWLMKSEPDVYSIDDLKKDKVGHWDGVRNYQARNFMRDQMKKGDLVLFYHSNSEPSGVAGIAAVAREGYPDFTQFDKNSEYFEPRAKKDNPVWIMVDLQFKEKFKSIVSLDTLRKTTSLKDMMVIRRGIRLSIQPVSELQFDVVKKLADKTK